MLNFRKKNWIVTQKARGKLTDSEIASVQRISRMTVNRIWCAYQTDGLNALMNKPAGRKIDEIPKRIQDKILLLRRKDYGIIKIGELLDHRGIKVSKRKITRVLKFHNLHTPEPKKGKRYKYIRWERNHSNSLWQTDFCWVSKLDCWITAWLDDHSRLITAAEYLTEATTDNALGVFEKGVRKWGLPRETLSDRGTQYYANLGETCRFLEHMKARGVKHIYASIKKPTTCGKLERWWRTHNDERWEFDSLREFVDHYNRKRIHMSLGYRTPYEVWKRDLKV